MTQNSGRRTSKILSPEQQEIERLKLKYNNLYGLLEKLSMSRDGLSVIILDDAIRQLLSKKQFQKEK